jgi:septum formation protein
VSAIVLASKSPSRAAVLRGAGVAFETADSGVDEAAIKAELAAEGADPRQVAERLAKLKATSVSARQEGFVVGADQTLDLDGVLFDKAATRAEARDRLLALRDRTHSLHAAVAVAKNGSVVWNLTESPRLTMRAFSEAFLDAYMAGAGEALLGSVGGYYLEGLGAQLFERIEGDYFAVLGLPLLPLLGFLRGEGALPS